MKANQIHLQLFMMILLCALLFSSCASFSNKIIWQERKKLSAHNLKELEGTYSLSPNLIYRNGSRNVGVLDSYLNRYLKNKKIDFDSLDRYSARISIIEINRLHIIIKKEQIIVDSVSLPTEIKTNGFLMVGKSKLKINGIPYLFGSFASEKSRISRNIQGDLIFNHVSIYGGALLLMIGIERRAEFAYHFKRTNH